MFAPNGPNAIEHEDAGCHCACCNQLRKPDKIITLSLLMTRQSVDCVNIAANVKSVGIAATQSRGNVIPISAAIKSAGQLRSETVEQAKFNYPMLECS